MNKIETFTGLLTLINNNITIINWHIFRLFSFKVAN